MGRLRSLSLFWRVALSNAAVLAAVALVLALTPITVSARTALSEAVVLALLMVALVVLNLVLLRPLFAPLERLNALMRRVDLLAPHEPVTASGPPEVTELVSTFNQMLERLEDERRESGRRALMAQELERQRVARELHDEIGQSLTALLLQIGRAADRAPAELGPELGEAREAARASLEDVRRVARRLRPEALDDLGLVSALTSLCTGFAERARIRVERHLERGLPPLDPEVELVVYRVAQESLTNAARHADPSRVTVHLEALAGGVLLRVVDDGVGMPADGPPADGDGIRGMRERALAIGAELAVGPGPEGRGAEVRLLAPARRSKA
jgi:two-component system sensor histidine kinase UhpB